MGELGCINGQKLQHVSAAPVPWKWPRSLVWNCSDGGYILGFQRALFCVFHNIFCDSPQVSGISCIVCLQLRKNLTDSSAERGQKTCWNVSELSYISKQCSVQWEQLKWCREQRLSDGKMYAVILMKIECIICPCFVVTSFLWHKGELCRFSLMSGWAWLMRISWLTDGAAKTGSANIFVA